jgi:hypothetical protein
MILYASPEFLASIFVAGPMISIVQADSGHNLSRAARASTRMFGSRAGDLSTDLRRSVIWTNGGMNSNIRLLTRAALLFCRTLKLCQKTRNLSVVLQIAIAAAEWSHRSPFELTAACIMNIELDLGRTMRWKPVFSEARFRAQWRSFMDRIGEVCNA